MDVNPNSIKRHNDAGLRCLLINPFFPLLLLLLLLLLLVVLVLVLVLRWVYKLCGRNAERRNKRHCV